MIEFKLADEDHLAIAELDPLHWDEAMALLPLHNENENLDSLLELLDAFLARVNEVYTLGIHSKLAIMRDLGMVMASVRKLGYQPCELKPGLEEALVRLGEDTHMPPRETSYHYGPWNPKGPRQRLFTRYKDELGLTEGVRKAIPGCEKTLRILVSLQNEDLAGEAFAVNVEKANRELKEIVEGMVYSVRMIDPWTFSNKLRPFFDPICVKGKSYIGPGGGQMPLFVIDRMVWYDEPDTVYAPFMEECKEFIVPEFRALFDAMRIQESLLGKVRRQLREQKTLDALCWANVARVEDLIRTLVKFRSPHQNLSQKSLNEKNRGNYKTGSAGYEISLVNHVSGLTSLAYTKIKELQALNN